LDLSLVNSFIIYKEICSSLNKKVPNLYEYKLDVALALMYAGSDAAERYVICGYVYGGSVCVKFSGKIK
jgi:hypothetical protein